MKSNCELQATPAFMSDIEHIRFRPRMYFGRLGNGSQYDDGIYTMLMRWLCSTADRLKTGVKQCIDINFVGARYVSVRDYGCGIPHDNMMSVVRDIMFR